MVGDANIMRTPTGSHVDNTGVLALFTGCLNMWSKNEAEIIVPM